jgi:hypothetical protein
VGKNNNAFNRYINICHPRKFANPALEQIRDSELAPPIHPHYTQLSEVNRSEETKLTKFQFANRNSGSNHVASTNKQVTPKLSTGASRRTHQSSDRRERADCRTSRTPLRLLASRGPSEFHRKCSWSLEREKGRPRQRLDQRDAII